MATFDFSIKLSFINSKKFKLAAASVLGITLILVGIGSLFSFYSNRIYPGISIDDTPVSGLTLAETIQIVQQNVGTVPPHMVALEVDSIVIASSSTDLQAQKDFSLAVENAYNHGRDASPLEKLNIILQGFTRQINFDSVTVYNSTALEKMVQTLKGQIDVGGAHPYASLVVSGNSDSITIDPGLDGRSLDLDKTLQLLIDTSHSSANVSKNGIHVQAVVASTSAQLTEPEILAATERAKKFVGRNAVFSADYTKTKISDQEMVTLLAFPQGISASTLEILATEWDLQVSNEPQDATFEYNPDTLEVITFAPHRDGLTLDVAKTKTQITELLNYIENAYYQEKEEAMTQPETTGNTPFIPPDVPSYPEMDGTIQLPLHIASQAPIKTLGSTNDLGITERIGFGDSNYDHSIPTRIHNVALTASKINTVIIPPGKEFSFNKTLGDVSQATGFKPAYVIRNGMTELGDGGGVCQVSTTLFRSLLDAGLPITKRKPHSYRVSYYELNQKPGIDATVYSGDVDLRFHNDTGKHVLIYTEADSDNLYMKVELYGTSDGRTSEIVDHKTWGAVPALATQYIPDSTLPTGKLKQIDWAASGIKASFKNIVKDKDGNVVREEEYVSNYRPWAAKYLRGV